MYSVLLASALAFLLGFSGVFLDVWHWAWGILFTLVALVGVWILISRRIGAMLHPTTMRLQQMMQARNFEGAMAALESMLPMARWVPFLRGQVLGQMGLLAWAGNHKEKALGLLEGSGVRDTDARLVLACILWKTGDAARALSVLQVAGTVNKKHALLHNTWAWMLHKQDKNDAAQEILAALQKRLPGDAPTKDNLLRLQNRTRMTMHGFEQWWGLRLEDPPQSMGQMRRAPNGFREPPKGKG
ncbi:MAG: hypothetical protein JNK15_02515 [Planctomycetes bacterium]|nr:hypothetical protein [Planctomycetota bacterium]